MSITITSSAGNESFIGTISEAIEYGLRPALASSPAGTSGAVNADATAYEITFATGESLALDIVRTPRPAHESEMIQVMQGDSAFLTLSVATSATSAAAAKRVKATAKRRIKRDDREDMRHAAEMSLSISSVA